jgi:hypothetical protein
MSEFLVRLETLLDKSLATSKLFLVNMISLWSNLKSEVIF